MTDAEMTQLVRDRLAWLEDHGLILASCQEFKVKGEPNDYYCNPVALAVAAWVNKQTGADRHAVIFCEVHDAAGEQNEFAVMVEERQPDGTWSCLRHLENTKVPPAVNKFINDFDAGMYPDLQHKDEDESA